MNRRHTPEAMSGWRDPRMVAFVVLGVLSLVLLEASHWRFTDRTEEAVAATDNLMTARFALARAHLAWERTATGDPTFEPLRSLAELDNATTRLSDLLRGRSALLGFSADGLVDVPEASELVRSLQDGIGELRATLTDGDGPLLSAVDVRLRFSELESLAAELERVVYNEVREGIRAAGRVHEAFMLLWGGFLLCTGVGIILLRRARLREITGRWSAEADRAAEEERRGRVERRLENLRSLTDAGVLLVDVDGRVLEMSRWWARALSMEESQWVGRPWWEMLHPDERQRLEDLWRDKADSRTSFALEARGNADGESRQRWLTAHWKPVETTEGGEAGNWVGTFLDVTHHRAVETQLHQAQKLEAVGRMTSGVAHDFNNLLTVMLTNAELLRASANDQDEDDEELLGDIERSAQAGCELVANLMRFSRKAEVRIEPVDLSDVAGEGMRLASKLLDDDVAVVMELPETGPVVHADPRALQQILLNLVSNARDAMPEGGRLVVSVDEIEADASFVEDRPWIEPGRFGRLTVTDTGTGMDRDTLDRIFEPFFSTKEEGVGTGLGLASVHGLVRQQGGHIHAYSEVGVGTSFRVYLPAVSEAAEAGDAEHGSARPSETAGRATPAHADVPGKAGVSGGALRILLVEDEEALRRTSERVLTRLGHHVAVTADPREALRKLGEAAGEYDLVISDISMDQIDGIELVKRSRERGAELPFVLTSGRHVSQMVGHAQLPDNVTFLAKPWSVESLEKAIGEARRRA
ncbi:MAG: ATP-binding protein [Gemmatimonadota bacterium]|nr:ATP-binding protein [Gemmatimonadota bacterium]